MKKSIALIFITSTLLVSCGLFDKIKEFLDKTVPDISEQVTATLDRGISELSVASADWQDILNKVINDLPAEVQSTLTNEVTNLLNRGIAATGAEIRCNVDFFRIRMQQGLQRIKAKFLGTELPPIEPKLCQVIPLAIDMSLAANRRNKLEFYGYDFDLADVKMFLVNGSTEINITQFLDLPTHYHMTLNLGGSGVQLRANSKRIILRWNGRNISTIAVIQSTPDICESKFDNFRPSNVSVIPIHTAMPGKSRGDREFSGHGPRVYCSVTLTNTGNSVRARVYMTAAETKSDWTYGKVTRNYTLYNADPGFEIEKIVTPIFASHSYTDSDHALDVFAGSGPVQKFILYGDGGGKDIGINTKGEIQFNPIRVQLKEVGDCISSATLRSLDMEGSISPRLKSKMTTMRSIKFISADELKPVFDVDTLAPKLIEK